MPAYDSVALQKPDPPPPPARYSSADQYWR